MRNCRNMKFSRKTSQWYRGSSGVILMKNCGEILRNVGKFQIGRGII